MNRREFFRLATRTVTKDENCIRPPGAVEEGVFQKICKGCGKCAQACPHQSIKLVNKYPCIMPENTPCYLCKEFPCRSACENGALNRVKTDEENKIGMAEIDKERCSAWSGMDCRMCYIKCPFMDEAIVLDDFKPVVVHEKCVGCGICENVCFMLNGKAFIKVFPKRVSLLKEL